MSKTVKFQDKPELKPGEVCGHCSLRAPPVHKCRMCQKPVPDWPADEELFLIQAEWEREPVEGGGWMEPESRFMRPAPESLLRQVKAQIASLERFLAMDRFKQDTASRGNAQAELTRAKDRLERWESGELVAVRPRATFNTDDAVEMELGHRRPYDATPRKIERHVFTKEQMDRREAELKRLCGPLTRSQEEQIRERRQRKYLVHAAMCVACHQW